MTYKTHFIGGICAVVVVSTVTPIENLPLVAGIGAVSALIPDIDIDSSKLGRKLGGISTIIESTFGHRGFIHTPILYALLSLLLSFVLPMSVVYGFLIGTLSHLVLDSFNYKGIMWLYPLTKKRFHIMSIKTRGFGEFIFTVFMVAITCAVFVLNADLGLDLSKLSITLPELNFTAYSGNSEIIGKFEEFVGGMLTF